MDKEPEPLFLLFAAICVGVFGYAVLRPMYDCRCFKEKPPPPNLQPEIHVVKIHPARANFRLWSPGKARYLSMPARPVSASVRKKKKSKKSKVLQTKFQACVNAIIEQNVQPAVALTCGVGPGSESTAPPTTIASALLQMQVLPEGGRRPPSAKIEVDRPMMIDSPGVLQLKRALFRARGRLKVNNATAPQAPPLDGATEEDLISPPDVFADSRNRLREAIFSGCDDLRMLRRNQETIKSNGAATSVVMNVMELESIQSMASIDRADDVIQVLSKSRPLTFDAVAEETRNSIRNFTTNRFTNRVSDLASPAATSNFVPSSSPKAAGAGDSGNLDFEKGSRKNNHRAINIPPCAPEYAW